MQLLGFAFQCDDLSSGFIHLLCVVSVRKDVKRAVAQVQLVRNEAKALRNEPEYAFETCPDPAPNYAKGRTKCHWGLSAVPLASTDEECAFKTVTLFASYCCVGRLIQCNGGKDTVICKIVQRYKCHPRHVEGCVVLIIAGIEAIAPATYPPHLWLGAIIKALDVKAGRRDMYVEQLHDKAKLLAWKRSDRESSNVLKYDGDKDVFLDAVTRVLHICYQNKDTVVICSFLELTLLLLYTISKANTM
jgi:hypothetical protein